MPSAIAPVRRATSVGYVLGAEVPLVLAARDVDGAPAAAAADERRAQLVRDAGRVRAPRGSGCCARDARRSCDRAMPTGTRRDARLGERVEVLDEVLAGDHGRAGLPSAVSGVNTPSLDQLVRRVAGHQARLRIERVPAGGVAGRRRGAVVPLTSAEVLLAREAATSQQRDVVDEPDRSASAQAGAVPVVPPPPRAASMRPAGNIPATKGSTRARPLR